MPFVKMWTMTTDPKRISADEALRTIARRWHVVHRGLLHVNPNFHYFKVIELTKKGFVHVHFLTNDYIPFHWFHQLVQKHLFGIKLRYDPIPRDRVIKYVSKYVTKTFESIKALLRHTVRIWTASCGLLPIVKYFDPDGDWNLVLVDFRRFEPRPTFRL
jgi:hypothetical protein